MPIFHISKEAQKLVGLALDYYEAGDCECARIQKIHYAHCIDETVPVPDCLHCELWDRIGAIEESVFTELRNELK